MKRKLPLAAVCLMLILLSACSGKSSATDSHWNAAKKAGGLENYVQEQAGEIDMDALKQDAAEGDLKQQFKATALMCALEYQQDKADASTPDTTRFQFDYPVSREYAERFLSQVNSDAEAFWASMEDAFSPYDCYLPILAAAKELDGQTLVKLLDSAPSDKAKFTDAVDKWIEQNPGKIITTGDALLDYGYFDGAALTDIRSAYCSLSPNTFKVRMDTGEDAFRYVVYLRDKLLPAVATETDRARLLKISDITGEGYYSDSVMVTITGNGPTLQEPTDTGLPETIDLEGKTVAALYRNPATGDFDDYLPSLQLMGGFLLALPEAEVPASLADADYYLVLTANYELGDYYQTAGGSNTAIRQVNSRTSVDLYDAATGAFLRHLGNVLEEAPDSVYASATEESLQYPVPVSSDILAYLYHHVNEPESYVSLVDHTPVNGSVLEKDQPVIFGNWEIVYHSAQIVKQFETGMYIYTADEGEQFVMAKMTVTNLGLQSDTFLPIIYYVNEDPIVKVTDSSKETAYNCVDALMHSACLNNTTLDPNVSKDGDLIFEIPDELAQSGETLYLAVSLGNQTVYYPLS